jgi:hypothetical protein
MPDTDTAPESPTQIHLRGGGGAVMTFDLPINEHVQRQLDGGELRRVNPDGTPYTGRKWKPAKESPLTPADAQGLDDYERMVREAEAEAEEAGRLAEALEERVRDGDDSVTPAELTNARDLQKFATLRKTAAERKAVKAREAERQRQLAALKDEILQWPGTDRAHLAELLREAETALTAFAEASVAHNAQVSGWYQRMRALGVTVPGTPQGTSAEHRHLGYLNSSVYGVSLLVGSPPRRVGRLDTQTLIGAMLARVNARHQLDGLKATTPDVDPYALLKGGE